MNKIGQKKRENANELKVRRNSNEIRSSKAISSKLFPSTRSLSIKKTKVTCQYCNQRINSILFSLHIDSHPTKIFDWLYLGSYNNAINKKVGISYLGINIT